MDMEYATEFDVEYDYDVLDGKPIYIINLCGKDGYLAIGNGKKEKCEIRGNTLDEVKAKCFEVRTNTLVGHEISENVGKELGIIKMNTIVEDTMPNYRYRFVK